MDIKTKFNLGQTVYTVQPRNERIETICPICEGKGYIQVKNNHYNCPESNCHYGKVFKGYKKHQYGITHYSKIGQVRVELGKNYYEESYMLVATGVGSGTVWYDDENKDSRIFATKKEAEEYCKLKNKEK